MFSNKTIPTVITIFLGTSAFADCTKRPDRVSILVGSEHLNATTEFTEINPGVFLSWDCHKTMFTAGIYKNSLGDPSPSALVSYELYEYQDFSLSAFAGISYFPEIDELDLEYESHYVPLVGLQTNYKNIFMQFIPGVENQFDMLVTAGLRFDLD
ncbi:hypothetical protein [Yoonia maritima]|uniref:hypothetical protein n=1 Tax=Yoonia maritima TaxID=1435347 RepID=UPI0013A63FB4|nr:hypothetical protein [Yoonia maritima]